MNSHTERGYEIGSSPQHRIDAFLAAGIPEAGIAEAVGVSEATVTYWHTDSTAELTDDFRMGLNHLRQAMKIIIDNGVDPEFAAVWLQSPLGDNPENTPIRHLAEEPQVVLDGMRKIFGPREVPLSPNAVKYRQADNTTPRDGSLFTEREELVLPYVTHHSSLKVIDEIFDSRGDPVNRLLRRTRERIGGETVIDFMLIAIAAKAASIDHVPRGRTGVLTERDKMRMADYYSPDPEERAAARSKGEGWWDAIYDKLEIDREIIKVHKGYGRHTAVLYGVKDGVISLPKMADIRAGRHPKPVSNRKRGAQSHNIA